MQDFISLAKWEDRGYYALKTSIEKSQRQLHKLARHVSQHLATLTSDVLQSELNADIKSGSFATFCAGEGKLSFSSKTLTVAFYPT